MIEAKMKEQAIFKLYKKYPFLNCLKKKKYKLVIVAIFKNEAIAMREWLEHYIRQGVEHFYIINMTKSKYIYLFLLTK